MAFSTQVRINYLMTVVGLVCASVSCTLRAWKVTFPDEETDPDARIWEGLWEICQLEGTGEMRCKGYNTLITVAQDLKVSRVCMVIYIIGASLWLLLSPCWWLCLDSSRRTIQATFQTVVGVMLLSVSLLVMISLSWVTHNVIHGSFNPVLGYSKKAEMGAALYLAWTSSLLLMLGGVLLLVNIPSCYHFLRNRLSGVNMIPQMFDGQHTHSWSGRASSGGLSPGSRVIDLGENRQVYGAAHELCSGLCGCSLLSGHHAAVGFLVTKLPESPRNF